MTLSVCIPTRNEARRIARCIESVHQISGVTVTIGDDSTDATKAIARSLGAMVVPCPGMPIDEARNALIDVARGGWCLAFDADQILTPQGARAIVTFLAANPAGVGAVRLPVHNAASADALPDDVVAGRGRLSPPFHPVMLHRREWRGARARFRNPVHETLSQWVTDNAVPEIAINAPVAHYGAIPELRRDEQRDERNRRLLRQWIEQDPGSLEPYHYLTLDAFTAGDHVAAVAWFDRAIRAAKDLSDTAYQLQHATIGRLYLTRACVAADVADSEAVEHFAYIAGSILGPHPDIDFLFGTVAESAEQYETALRHYMSATQRGLYSSLTLAGSASWGSLARCGVCLAAMGEPDDAREAFSAALACPDIPPSDRNWISEVYPAPAAAPG